jgi:hypothetical protein
MGDVPVDGVVVLGVVVLGDVVGVAGSAGRRSQAASVLPMAINAATSAVRTGAWEGIACMETSLQE